jgi:hypothetical protein
MATHAREARTPRVRAPRGKTELTAADIDQLREMIQSDTASLRVCARALGFGSHTSLSRAITAAGLKITRQLCPLTQTDQTETKDETMLTLTPKTETTPTAAKIVPVYLSSIDTNPKQPLRLEDMHRIGEIDISDPWLKGRPVTVITRDPQTGELESSKYYPTDRREVLGVDVGCFEWATPTRRRQTYLEYWWKEYRKYLSARA